MKGINKIKIVVVGLFVITQSLCLFSEDALFDFDGREQYKDTSFTMTDVKLPEVKKTKDIFGERKLFRLLDNGDVEEVLPFKDIDGKNYYKFKPNDKFYSRYNCTTSQPSNQTYYVCEGFKFDPKLAGHNHNANIPPYNDWNDKPLPNPTCTPVTQVNNYSYIYFKAPPFSTRADHRIQYYGCNNSTYYDIIDIKIDGLIALKPAYQDSLHNYTTYYNLIGETTTHPVNHFARSQTIDLLKEIAWKYHEEFPKSEVLNINDISLIWGGLFDIDGNWQQTQHTVHRYGRQVDVRLRSIPTENVERFKQICCELGVEVELHSKDHQPLDVFEAAVWEKINFNLPPWNQLSEKELDTRTPHYHLVFPKYDDEIDNPPDQIPQGCPPVIYR